MSDSAEPTQRGGGRGGGRGGRGGDRGGRGRGGMKRSRSEGDAGDGGEGGNKHHRRDGENGRGGRGGRGRGGEFRGRDRGDRGGRGRGGRGGGDRRGGGRGRGGDRGGRGGRGRGGRGRGPLRAGERIHRELPPPLTPEQIAANLATSTLVFPSESSMVSANEESVGMTVYRSMKLAPFTATFKQRFSDFLVHEIGTDGKVLRFTNTDIPVEAKVAEVEEEVKLMDPEEGKKEMSKLVGDDYGKKFSLWLLEEQEKQRLLTAHKLKMKAKRKAEAKDDKEDNTNGPNTTASETTESSSLSTTTNKDGNDDTSANKDSNNNGTSQLDSLFDTAGDDEEVDVDSLQPADFKFAKGSMNKEKRTALHKLIRECWPNLTSDVIDGTGKLSGNDKDLTEIDKQFRVQYTKTNRAGKQRKPESETKRLNNEWPPNRPPYLQFVLYKENRDTMEAAFNIAKNMHIPVKTFSYAGTKDKRAITVQLVTAYKTSAERLKSFIARELKLGYNNLRVGNFAYVNKNLTLGQLNGNRFTVVLRCIKAEEKDVINALQHVQQTGFINYYGMQRFGTGDVPTHVIGQALLKEEYDRAIALILMPRLHEKEEVTEARKYYRDTRDTKGAIARMPKSMQVERSVLEGLDLCGINSFFNTIQRLPRNMRLMYVHAYQSYVWNHMVSVRLSELDPNNLVEGDLVLKQGAKATLDDDAATEDIGAMRVMATDNASTTSSSTAINEGKRSSSASDVGVADHSNSSALKQMLANRVHIITSDDIKSKRYSITDLVLPLPGHSVTYPNNIVGQRYKEFMSKDIAIENLDNPKVKDFSLPGGYRKVIEMAGDLEWKIFRYKNPNIPLALTDQDIQDGKKEPESIPDGDIALRLSFNLPSSTYATMMVREVLKVPNVTTVDFQRTLVPDDHKDKRKPPPPSSSSTSTSTETAASTKQSSPDNKDDDATTATGGGGDGEGDDEEVVAVDTTE